jgi:RNA polymerase sigma factor (sigma-70 family)
MNTGGSDAELLSQYSRHGEEAAFAEIVRRYIGIVYHAALRQLTGDSHAAEDVAQKVFALLARKAGSLAGHTALAGWLHATTRLIARETIRAERRRRTREHEAALMQQLSTNDLADPEQLRAVLDDAIGELNERDRETVLLRFFAGLRLTELGAKLGLSENSARMRVERALERLEQSLARRGVTSTAGALAIALANQAAAVPVGLAQSVTSAALAAPASAMGAAILASVSTSTLKIVTAAAIGLVATGLATREVHTHQTRTANLEFAQIELQQERERLRMAAQRANAAEAELAAAARPSVASLSVAANGNTASHGQPVVREEMWDPHEQGQAFLGRHPQVRDRFVAWTHAQTDFQYGALYRQLGLTPAQIDEFRSVMLDQSGYAPDVGTTERQLTLRMGEGSLDETEQRLRRLLGPWGFERYQAYEKTLPSREVTAQVAGALCFTAEPLTSAQAETLVQVIAATRKSPGANKRGIDWDRLLRDATGLLTPTQVSMLQRVAEQQRLMHAVDAAIVAATRDANMTDSAARSP